MMDKFDKFSKDLEEISNTMSLKTAVVTARKGKAKWRDRLILGKFAWQEALSFIAIIQSLIIFSALIPNSIVNVNSVLAVLHIPIVLSVQISSLAAVCFIIFVFVFGWLAVRHLGTVTSNAEYSTKMNPGMYLLWMKLEKLEEKVEELKKEEK